MIDSPYASREYVTVAVDFDRHTGALVRVGHELANQLGRKLCLVHVVSPWTDAWSTRPLAAAALLRAYEPQIDHAARERAAARLREVALENAPGASPKLIVARGPKIATLIHEADTAETCLLLVGAGAAPGALFPSGIGTALSLLDQAPMPVMALDGSGPLPQLRSALRILIADDLTDQSEAAVAFASTLANGNLKAWIHHVHASGMTADDLRTALESASAAAHAPLASGFTDNIFRGVLREQQQGLEARFDAYRDLLEVGGGKYTSEVIGAGLQPALEGIVKDMAPDVLVFGRHRMIHTKPFALGRMPNRAMLAFGRPVIVVPPL